jgi:hypothetical protein
MGRKSKLTDGQWEEIGRRIVAGEKPAALAREFKVSPSTISERFSKTVENVKAVANQIVATDQALKSLSIPEQISAVSLAQDLISISGHLAGAAKFGSATAHRLAGIAHGKVQEIDDAAPLNAESVEALKGVAALTKLANDSASIALNLLAANKETVKELNLPKPEDEPPPPLRPQISREEWLKIHGHA